MRILTAAFAAFMSTTAYASDADLTGAVLDVFKRGGYRVAYSSVGLGSNSLKIDGLTVSKPGRTLALGSLVLEEPELALNEVKSRQLVISDIKIILDGMNYKADGITITNPRMNIDTRDFEYSDAILRKGALLDGEKELLSIDVGALKMRDDEMAVKVSGRLSGEIPAALLSSFIGEEIDVQDFPFISELDLRHDVSVQEASLRFSFQAQGYGQQYLSAEMSGVTPDGFVGLKSDLSLIAERENFKHYDQITLEKVGFRFEEGEWIVGAMEKFDQALPHKADFLRDFVSYMAAFSIIGLVGGTEGNNNQFDTEFEKFLAFWVAPSSLMIEITPDRTLRDLFPSDSNALSHDIPENPNSNAP